MTSIFKITGAVYFRKDYQEIYNTLEEKYISKIKQWSPTYWKVQLFINFSFLTVLEEAEASMTKYT